MTTETSVDRTKAPSIGELARCLDCRADLLANDACPVCGRAHPTADGILEAIGPLEGRNRTVAAFYDGHGWPRFRKWERLFLGLQGGARRARMSILRHVLAIERPSARILEVGIGDGENLRFLPASWEVYGVDIARIQLLACARRYSSMSGRLAWAEAERLPFPDGTFDACYSVGGFTYYGDHAAALAEMRRVTRAGGPVVVADETPGMRRAGIGHLIRLPAIDKLWLRQLGLDPGFIDMVLGFDVDLRAVTARAWPDAARFSIWSGLGYCLVDPAPATTRSTTTTAPSRSIP
jgi:SAM-dependent methyltransferase